MKVVINESFGGFSLSEKAILEIARRKGITLYRKPSEYADYNLFYLDEARTETFHEFDDEDRPQDRWDPDVVAVVEELGDEANGHVAHLSIEWVPPGTVFRIDEYDGRETIEYRDLIGWHTAT